MPLFAFSAYVDGRLERGEVVAADADQARGHAALYLHGKGERVELRQVFEPPMRRIDAPDRLRPAEPPTLRRSRGRNYRDHRGSN